MRRLMALAIALTVVTLDQLTKQWIVTYFSDYPPGGEIRTFTPFFNLALVHNRGMSFGLFNGNSSSSALLLSLLAGIIIAALLIWLWQSRSLMVVLGIGLVVGGAIGNVLDRLRLGYVVDFLDFHVFLGGMGDQHWPAFNLADSAITMGVVMLLTDGLLVRRESPN